MTDGIGKKSPYPSAQFISISVNMTELTEVKAKQHLTHEFCELDEKHEILHQNIHTCNSATIQSLLLSAVSSLGICGV